jgi:hypothetical protein
MPSIFDCMYLRCLVQIDLSGFKTKSQSVRKFQFQLCKTIRAKRDADPYPDPAGIPI